MLLCIKSHNFSTYVSFGEEKSKRLYQYHKIIQANKRMKASSFLIVTIIFGVVVENIVTRYLLLNLDQEKKDGNITGKIKCILFHDHINSNWTKFNDLLKYQTFFITYSKIED